MILKAASLFSYKARTSALRRNLSTSLLCRQLQAKRSEKIVEGSVVEGFRIDQVTHVPDFSCSLIRLEHLGTGAQYTHIDRDDSNNVFGIAFRTTPFDSTGIPHILEHLTLMGSQKYPCRDPFFKMLNRSLATYLNALTYPDFTVYPLATRNRTDYYNLMSVYLDAVFRPKLGLDYFQMEGWRLEHENVEDRSSPVVFKGVVFNEMKGVYSENQNIFMEKMSQNLLPSHTYGVNSGGDPLEIPKLTYENLVTFRNNHYHPSNSKMYSYGNLDLLDRLKFINEQYLLDYTRCEEYSKKTYVPREPRWSESRKRHCDCKNDPLAVDPEKQSMLTVAYLLEDVRNVHETFELQILCYLLIEGPNSPFYKNLIESKIGSGYAPSVGFDAHTRDSTFNIGLQALSEKDFNQVENVVYKTFEEVKKNGFERDAIENVLHNIELGIRNQGADLGTKLLFTLSPLWNHDGDITDALQLSYHMEQFRKNLQNNQYYLQKLVDKYFISNNHRLIQTMSPKNDYEEEMKQKEAQVLNEMLSKLTNEDFDKIYSTGLELRKIQDTKDNIECLPTLRKTDIKKDYEPSQVHLSNTTMPLQICTLPTNNITYFRAILDASQLSESRLSILSLFAHVFPNMGTGKYDYRKFNVLVQNKTGGLDAQAIVIGDIHSCDKFEVGLNLSSLCLDRNCPDMFRLWSELLNDAKLDDCERFSTLVTNLASDLVNGVANSGHTYAMLNAASRVNHAAQIDEQLGGLSFIEKMKHSACANMEECLQEIRNIREAILNISRIRISVNLSPGQHSVANSSINDFISQFPGSSHENLIKKSAGSKQRSVPDHVHYVLPFAVNYCAKAVQTVPYIDPDFPALAVLSKLLTTKYLLPMIRERFGAYGAGVKVSLDGVLQYYSYRDPNTIGTMKIFDGSGEWLKKNDFTQQDIDEAILAVFREIDVPLAPKDHGMRLFVNGISDELFSKHRLDLLKVCKEDLYRVAEKYLQLPGAYVLLGPENSELSKDWKRVEP